MDNRPKLEINQMCLSGGNDENKVWHIPGILFDNKQEHTMTHTKNGNSPMDCVKQKKPGSEGVYEWPFSIAFLQT